MLHVLTQSNAASVWADRHAELYCHQKGGQILVDPGNAAAINLTDVDRACLEKLFEHDNIVAMLASCDACRVYFVADASMAEDVVTHGWLFHPPGLELFQLLRSLNGFIDTPFLI